MKANALYFITYTIHNVPICILPFLTGHSPRNDHQIARLLVPWLLLTDVLSNLCSLVVVTINALIAATLLILSFFHRCNCSYRYDKLWLQLQGYTYKRRIL